MTVEERRMTVAYADMLCIRDLIGRIPRVGAYRFLSKKGKEHFNKAYDAIEEIMDELAIYMANNTDFSSDKNEGSVT